MSQSRQIKDYPYLLNPGRLSGIKGPNVQHVQDFITQCRIKDVSLNAINTMVIRIASWMRVIGEDKDTAEWTLSDVERAYLVKSDEVSEGLRSAATLDGELRAIKSYWAFCNSNKPQITIKRKQTKLNLLSTDIVSTEQIVAMRDAADRAGDLRGAALIMALLGTGCRLSELLDANIKDLTIHRQYATIKVDGKTGVREIPFVTGLPELQTWINHHPCKDDLDAPIFVTMQTRGHGHQRMSKKTVEAMMGKYKRLAGIPDEVKANPHALRHRAASEAAHHMTSKELCMLFGWSDQSDMPKTYTHTSQEEVQKAVLEMSGVQVPDAVEATPLTIQCPRCGKINRAGAKYCDGCSLILSEELAKTMSEVEQYMLQRMKDMMM